MATAFQSNAFQDNAFQIDAGAVVAAFRSGGGGIQPKRRKTLRLPFKPTGFGGYKKKTKVEERLEEAHAVAQFLGRQVNLLVALGVHEMVAVPIVVQVLHLPLVEGGTLHDVFGPELLL